MGISFVSASLLLSRAWVYVRKASVHFYFIYLPCWQTNHWVLLYHVSVWGEWRKWHVKYSSIRHTRIWYVKGRIWYVKGRTLVCGKGLSCSCTDTRMIACNYIKIDYHICNTTARPVSQQLSFRSMAVRAGSAACSRYVRLDEQVLVACFVRYLDAYLDNLRILGLF